MRTPQSKFLVALATAAIAAAAAFAQAAKPAPAAAPEFEVASIRPSQPSGPNRVDASLRMDGALAHFSSLSVRNYISLAYHIQTDLITGPDWLGGERFDVNAKLPDGSTTAEIPAMMQSLLATRFGLKFHWESREMPAYALVLGKPPLKLKELPADATPPASPATPVIRSASGSFAGVSLDLGNGSSYTFADNQFQFKKVTMDIFAAQLSRCTDRPIVNLSSLHGSYDVTLQVTPEDYRLLLIRSAVNSGVTLPPRALQFLDSGSPVSLFDAIRQQGLALDSRKLPLKTIVVDQALRTPTEN